MRPMPLLLTSLLLSLAACSSDSGGSGSDNKEAALQVKCVDGKLVDAGFNGIVGGTVVEAKSWISKKTFLIMSKVGVCTATLIDRDVVLTAAHCVKGAEIGKMGAIFSRQPECDVENNVITQNDMVLAASFKIHEGYKDDGQENDIALIKLVRQAPSSYQTVSLTAKDAYDQGATRVLAAGYGRTVGQQAEDANPLLLRATVLDVLQGEALGTVKKRFGEAKLSPEVLATPEAAAALSNIFDPKPNGQFLLLDQTKGSGICMGDSGGPAFLNENGTIRQTGVAAFVVDTQKVATCQFVGAYTNVKFHRAWLESNFKQIKSYTSKVTSIFAE